MKVRFVLICEGPSDSGLVVHLQTLCIQCGASEAIGSAPDFRRLPVKVARDVKTRLTVGLKLEPSANLIFVHRDADSRDEDERLSEILAAGNEFPLDVVPVIPVQATEAWLLLDEGAIRAAVENPNGRGNLELPGPARLESIAAPKTKLQDVLLAASETTGRRRQRVRQEFNRHRAMLLERLDTSGRITSVPAWQRLAQRVREAIQKLPERPTSVG